MVKDQFNSWFNCYLNCYNICPKKLSVLYKTSWEGSNVTKHLKEHIQTWWVLWWVSQRASAWVPSCMLCCGRLTCFFKYYLCLRSLLTSCMKNQIKSNEIKFKKLSLQWTLLSVFYYFICIIFMIHFKIVLFFYPKLSMKLSMKFSDSSLDSPRDYSWIH